MMTRTVLFTLGLAALMTGCSNVNQMKKKYEAGDEKQLDKLMEIVTRGDYPYATRRNAARILGEIGSERAVPALIHTLNDYDRRSTLKEEAIHSLGKIGDPRAVDPIGHLLDRSLQDPNAELRLAAIPVLGEIGGKKAAGILVNALFYYDRVKMRQEEQTLRGIFTGEEIDFPVPGRVDSTTGQRTPRPVDPFGEQANSPVGLFGPSFNNTQIEKYDSTEEEHQMAHQALVNIGPVAVPAINDYLAAKRSTPTLTKELLRILDEIRQDVDTSMPDTAAEDTVGHEGE